MSEAKVNFRDRDTSHLSDTRWAAATANPSERRTFLGSFPKTTPENFKESGFVRDIEESSSEEEDEGFSQKHLTQRVVPMKTFPDPNAFKRIGCLFT